MIATMSHTMVENINHHFLTQYSRIIFLLSSLFEIKIDLAAKCVKARDDKLTISSLMWNSFLSLT